MNCCTSRKPVPRGTFRPAIFVLCIVAAGCSHDGPELADVHGTITLNGQPLAGALVEFQPERRDGSPSYGATDDTGRYELVYSRDRKGAMIGLHSVQITTRNENQRTPELLPSEYHDESAITREVAAGTTNQFDFEISLPESPSDW